MQEQKVGAVKKIKAVEEAAGSFRKKMYADAHAAKERGQKVAWNFFGSYTEPILAAFDIVSAYPENYGAVCAAKRVQQPFLEAAESEGYPFEACGYTRVSLGFSLLCQRLGAMPPSAPYGGMPGPDIVLVNSTLCDSRQKFAQAVRRYWRDVAIFCLDVVWPPQGARLESAKGYYIEYLTAELRRLIAFLEQQTGRKLDKDRLWHYIRLHNEVLRTYDKIFKLLQAVPSPMGALDFLPLSPGYLFFNCEEETLELFTRVHDEVKQKVDQKIAAIPNEKYRLVWSQSPPPWYALPLFSYFETLGATFVNGFSIFGGDGSDTELDDSVDTLAWRQWERYNEQGYFFNCTFPHFPEVLARCVEEAKVDGLVVWRVPGCRLSLAQIYYRDKAEQILKRKLPTLFLECDQVDASTYSEAETKAKVDAFIEVLASSK